jgi:hypothetical protein
MIKYQLQPYSGMQSRYRCPACNHRRKTFTQYIDTDTGEQLAPHVGKCDRLDNCGYHFKPSQYFSQVRSYQLAVSSSHRSKTSKKRLPHAPETDYYISPDYVNNSFVNYQQNNFVQYLIGRFGLDVADELVGRYRIGTSSHWHGATIFWQLDTHGRIRTGKIMLYDKNSGKRVKQPYNHITWVHTQLLKHMEAAPAFHLNQCLFGEHLLLTSPYKPVAIVESEKTAIIASALMPAFIWLASGSLEGLNPKKCDILRGKQIMLFPDVNAYSKWQKKAMELQRALPGTKFIVSDVLEKQATPGQRKAGADLGDVVFA